MVCQKCRARRTDLLRAAVLGPEGTPYADQLFVFDIQLSAQHPGAPPQVVYHSWGLRVNPNLYEDGKARAPLPLEFWGQASSALDTVYRVHAEHDLHASDTTEESVVGHSLPSSAIGAAFGCIREGNAGQFGSFMVGACCSMADTMPHPTIFWYLYGAHAGLPEPAEHLERARQRGVGPQDVEHPAGARPL